MADPSGSDRVDDSLLLLPPPDPPTGLPHVIKKTMSDISDPQKKKNKSGDIRSFFASTTAPCSSSSSPSRMLSRRTTEMKKKKTTTKQVGGGSGAMSQLMLDLSDRPTTQTCKECGMSFVSGVVEDMEMHAKHHRGVVDGVEWRWLSSQSQSQSQSEDGGGCRVVWRELDGMSSSEQIVKLSLEPGQLRRSGYKAKVDQILLLVNRSLDAQELTQDQLRDSVVYLYLGSPDSSGRTNKKRRLNHHDKKKKKLVVKAMCVAARIEYGYRIVSGLSTDELCCSSQREKALVGIHRIWSAPPFRGMGLGFRLLSVVASSFIHGMPIDGDEMRRSLVAFSQPTESGMRLAVRWLGTAHFMIFKD